MFGGASLLWREATLTLPTQVAQMWSSCSYLTSHMDSDLFISRRIHLVNSVGKFGDMNTHILDLRQKLAIRRRYEQWLVLTVGSVALKTLVKKFHTSCPLTSIKVWHVCTHVMNLILRYVWGRWVDDLSLMSAEAGTIRVVSSYLLQRV